jgi:hypothetical protein
MIPEELERSLCGQYTHAIGNGQLGRLEEVGDCQPLSSHEEALCKELKLKAMGLSLLQRTIASQESWVLWLREGDASTNFFSRALKCVVAS